MDSETDTDTISICDSETSRENYKSPESSDCEGYATPLASSMTDLTDTNAQDDVKAGERTPVSTSRAISPPIVKQIMYLQKPKILTMTQRNIQEEFDSSEEEFYDVKTVAQQLYNGVPDEFEEETEDRDFENEGEDENDEMEGSENDVEIETEEDGEEDAEVSSHVEEDSSEVECKDAEDHEDDIVVDEVLQEIVEKTVSNQSEEQMNDTEVENSQESKNSYETPVDPKSSDAIPEKESSNSVETQLFKSEILNENEVSVSEIEAHDNSDGDNDIHEINALDNAVQISGEPTHDAIPDQESTNLVSENVVVVSKEDACKTEVAENAVSSTENTSEETITLESLKDESDHEEKIEEPAQQVLVENVLETNMEKVTPEIESPIEMESFPVQEHSCDVITELPSCESKQENCAEKEANIVITEERLFNSSPDAEIEVIRNLETDRPNEIFEEIPEVFSEISIAKTPLTSDEPKGEIETSNQETMPNLVISDEVKMCPTRNDFYSERWAHEVKVDFDGYSSGREESLSSSTSSESFEFSEPVSTKTIHDEKTVQALRNSIIERYPSHETDEDDLDSVCDELDENAVKQISAEVEQLVAAINAFGRDEEQQMSAYLVGKNMAAEKKRRSPVTPPCQDQLVQTDDDSLILVDRQLPEVMENLQSEIDRLHADLEKVKIEEKELLKINSKLKNDLEESQQTIDGIEVEAEQQYTELTSEIDELCEIVLKKDQELAALKEKIVNLSVSDNNLRDDVESQRVIVQRQKEIIESLREELDAITKKLGEVTKARDKAIEEATVYKMKNMERDRFLSKEAQMSMEIEDLQRELNKQKLILNQTSMAKLAETFDRKVLHLENELRERDMLICKQNQIINSHRKSPTGSIITTRKMQPRASVLAAAGNLPSAGSSSESFQNGLDVEAKEALLSFILSDRHNQLANIYNIGRILDLTAQEERAVERHLTKDRFT